MKKILILLLGLFSVAHAQFSPTSAKTAFKWGVSIGTRDSTAYAANDSLVVVINRQGRLMYRSTDGYWKLLANAASSDFVPYTGAVDNVALGNFRLTARSLRTDSIYANSSAGMYLATNSGSVVAHWGSGGSVEVDFKGFAGYDANRASSYTARSFTDKNYVDSSAGLRVRYTDTAAMLSPYLRRTDSTGLLSQVVRTFGTQTVGGNKTFTNDIFTSTARIGIGAGGNSSNSVLGYNVFTSNTTGTKNTAMGENSLSSNVSATDNTAFGWYSLDAATGSGNTGIGSGALGTNTSGSNNTALGFGAGEYVTGTNPNSTGTNSIYIGFNTKASANGETNQTVIGHNLTGNGSNTVTIGNSSVTDNYFTGNIRGGAFIRSGGTSSQFLKADGSVDGTSYATAASISGTTNYIPKFTSSSAIGNSDLRTDASNNLGLGVTPSAWATGQTAFQVGSTGAFYNVGGGTWVGNNFYNNNTPSAIYLANGFASVYGQQNNGSHAWYTAPSGTAGNVVTFTERLNLSSSSLTSYVPINGTSLSMSGGGSFGGAVSGTTATFGGIGTFQGGDNGTALFLKRTGGINVMAINVNSDGSFEMFDHAAGSFTSGITQKSGTVLINTTTTDGTNKLIVNGGVKAQGTNENAVIRVVKSNSGNTVAYLGTGSSGADDLGLLDLSDGGTVKARIFTGGTSYFNGGNVAIGKTTASTALDVVGAATFSSSVTATNATLTANTASTSTTTGALVVTGGVGVGGNMTIPRITSAGSTPTIAITSGTNTVGTGATVSVSGNDMAGVVTLNTGTGITNAGATMQLTFASAYSTTAPVVVVTVRAGGKIVYSATSSTTTATFTAFDQLGDSTTYTINYIIIAR